MTPVRLLAVGDDGSALLGVIQELSAEGLEVFRATVGTASPVVLSRVRPDVVLLDLTSAGPSAEDWRRALIHHRRGHVFSALVISPSANVQRLFSEVGDLGVHAVCPNGDALLESIRGQDEDAEPLSRAG